MNETVTQFYADITPYYHLVHGDWEKTIEQQAQTLDAVMRESWGPGVHEVLDTACGIGTQCLGLANIGYQVTASDLSPESIERARLEARTRNLAIPFSVTDMRAVFDHHARQFDAVIACDNAVPHLLNDEDILKAFTQFYACTRPGGGCIISVRDYDALDMTGQKFQVYGTRKHDDIDYIVFQKWVCHEDYYDLSMYFVGDDGGSSITTKVMRSRYNIVSITRLMELMRIAGFKEVSRIDKRFFQPLIIGTRKE